MKRIITESQLKQIISESVKQVLNELDPRTYASYAAKRAAQGQKEKANVGREAAANAWNEKYGNKYSDSHRDTEYTMKPSNYSVSYRVNRKFDDPKKFNSYEEYYEPSNDMKRTSSYSNAKPNGEYAPTADWAKNNNKYTPQNNAEKVAYQMTNGTGEYVNGEWRPQ